MRITIVQGPFLPITPLLGGAIEKRFWQLAPYWASLGHTVTHISRAFKDLPAQETIKGVQHIRVPSSDSSGNMIWDKFLDLRYALGVLKHLPPADILVTHTFFMPILARQPHKHGQVFVYMGRFPKGQIPLYRHVARLIVPSQAVKSAALFQAPFLKKKIHTIPNAVSNPLSTPFHPVIVIPESINSGTKAPFGRALPTPPYKLLFVGRIHPEKGLHVLLSALALLPQDLQKNIQLKIVGPHESKSGGGGEEYFARLQSLTQKTTAQITFTGPIFNADALAVEYAQADFFVYPSLADFGETFGVAPLEALSYGTPAIVSSLECFSDFISSNGETQNGWVFNHRQNPEENLAARIQNTIDSLSSWPQLSFNAQQTAQRFTLSKTADLFLKEFEAVLHLNDSGKSKK